jgi:hypothetical protein
MRRVAAELANAAGCGGACKRGGVRRSLRTRRGAAELANAAGCGGACDCEVCVVVGPERPTALAASLGVCGREGEGGEGAGRWGERGWYGKGDMRGESDGSTRRLDGVRDFCG